VQRRQTQPSTVTRRTGLKTGRKLQPLQAPDGIFSGDESSSRNGLEQTDHARSIRIVSC
jgi:hypothetical protein